MFMELQWHQAGEKWIAGTPFGNYELMPDEQVPNSWELSSSFTSGFLGPTLAEAKRMVAEDYKRRIRDMVNPLVWEIGESLGDMVCECVVGNYELWQLYQCVEISLNGDHIINVADMEEAKEWAEEDYYRRLGL